MLTLTVLLGEKSIHLCCFSSFWNQCHCISQAPQVHRCGNALQGEKKGERVMQTLTQLNCNLFVIWKHSSVVLAGTVAAVFIQWDQQSANSIALHNSGLTCFALSFISLLGPLSVSYRFHKKIFVCTECHLPTSKVSVNNNKQLAAIKCFYHDIGTF